MRYSKSRKVKVTFRDVLESIKTINKFLSFSLRLSRFFVALSQLGVDVSKINPYNFEDMIKMATSLRNQGVNVDFGDLEELKSEFEDIMDIDIEEMRKHVEVIRRYSGVLSNVLSTIKNVSKHMPKDTDEIKAITGLFGGLGMPQPGSSLNEDELSDLSEETETTLNEKDVEEFRKVINEFRKKHTSSK